MYSVSYEDGSFEACVPAHALTKEPSRPRSKIGSKPKTKHQGWNMLREAANTGDPATVNRCLQWGVATHFYDRQGFTPLHWAVGPEDGMPSDTADRLACIEALAPLSQLDAPDKSGEPATSCTTRIS